MVLAGILPEKLWHGLKLWDRDKPPSAPEFRRLCQQASMYRSHRALPKPKPTKQVAEAALHAMHKILKGGPESRQSEHSPSRHEE